MSISGEKDSPESSVFKPGWAGRIECLPVVMADERRDAALLCLLSELNRLYPGLWDNRAGSPIGVKCMYIPPHRHVGVHVSVDLQNNEIIHAKVHGLTSHMCDFNHVTPPGIPPTERGLCIRGHVEPDREDVNAKLYLSGEFVIMGHWPIVPRHFLVRTTLSGLETLVHALANAPDPVSRCE